MDALTWVVKGQKILKIQKKYKDMKCNCKYNIHVDGLEGIGWILFPWPADGGVIRACRSKEILEF